MSTADEIQTMLTDIEQRESKLSDWERTFVDDISAQLGRGRALTEKQDEKLEAIWERVT
jgi:hypothetical protein